MNAGRLTSKERGKSFGPRWPFLLELPIQALGVNVWLSTMNDHFWSKLRDAWVILEELLPLLDHVTCWTFLPEVRRKVPTLCIMFFYHEFLEL